MSFCDRVLQSVYKGEYICIRIHIEKPYTTYSTLLYSDIIYYFLVFTLL